jgi:hypothetical protein
VLDEIGISINGKMASVPTNNPIKESSQAAAKEDAELQRRLEALRSP